MDHEAHGHMMQKGRGGDIRRSGHRTPGSPGTITTYCQKCTEPQAFWPRAMRRIVFTVVCFTCKEFDTCFLKSDCRHHDETARKHDTSGNTTILLLLLLCASPSFQQAPDVLKHPFKNTIQLASAPMIINNRCNSNKPKNEINAKSHFLHFNFNTFRHTCAFKHSKTQGKEAHRMCGHISAGACYLR